MIGGLIHLINKIIIGLLIIIPFAFAIDINITQEQLDSVNASTLTWQDFQCRTDELYHYRPGWIYSDYNCSEIEPYVEEHTNITKYHIYDGEFECGYLHSDIWDIFETYGYERAYDEYWRSCAEQALTSVDYLISKIYMYQTHDDFNWTGSPFG